MQNYKDNIMSEIVSKCNIKDDNIECCTCLQYDIGLKLSNCNHYICPHCYYKMYYGHISNITRPICPHKPIYPYENSAIHNLEIYYYLTDNNTYMKWFVNYNEELYNYIKSDSELVVNIDSNIKKWFQHNELIKEYEKDVIEYNKNYKIYRNEMYLYLQLVKKERDKNLANICSLCIL